MTMLYVKSLTTKPIPEVRQTFVVVILLTWAYLGTSSLFWASDDLAGSPE